MDKTSPLSPFPVITKEKDKITVSRIRSIPTVSTRIAISVIKERMSQRRDTLNRLLRTRKGQISRLTGPFTLLQRRARIDLTPLIPCFSHLLVTQFQKACTFDPLGRSMRLIELLS